MIELTFLGTGTSRGIPEIGSDHPVSHSTDPHDTRTRTSAMVHTQGKSFLIDCGPDFRHQMLREKLDDVDALLITHEHTDHIGGIDDLRPINTKHNKNTPIYCEKRVEDIIRKKYDYAFADFKFPGLPQLTLHQVEENKPIDILGIDVLPLRGVHGKLPILGFKIGELAYFTDMSELADDTMESIQQIDTLVINCLQIKPHFSHFNLEQVLEIIAQVKPRVAYLTHISQYLGFHQEIKKLLPANVFPAYDGLKIRCEHTVKIPV